MIYEELQEFFKDFQWIDNIPEDQSARDKICLEAKAALLIEANRDSERFSAFIRNSKKSHNDKSYQLPDKIYLEDINYDNYTLSLTCNSFELLSQTVDDAFFCFQKCFYGIAFISFRLSRIFAKKNGGEGVNFQPLNAKRKNSIFSLNYLQFWHFIAHHILPPEIDKTEKKWGMPHSMVKKVEKSIVCLSANLQTGNQTIIPTDLKTVKYSTEQQIFNSYGEELWIFSGIK